MRRLARGDSDVPTGVRRAAGADPISAGRLVWEESGHSRAGNGSVMRCGPIGLRWMHDCTELTANSATAAAVTHRDHRSIWSAVVVDHAIAGLLRGDSLSPHMLLERASDGVARQAERLSWTAMTLGPPKAVREAAQLAFDPHTVAADLKLDSGGIGFAPKTMAAALWCSWCPDSFEDGLRSIVEEGGDTDTNGASAGAVLGARFGADAIPAEWRERVERIRSWEGDPSVGWLSRKPLDHYSEALLELAHDGR